MFPELQVAILFFLWLSVAVQPFNISNNIPESTSSPVVAAVNPPLTDFLNVTELASLQSTFPSDQIEWVNATDSRSSDKNDQKLDRRRHKTDNNLARRYVDPMKCTNVQRRVMLRNQLRAVMRMLHDVQTNLTLTHPVWRTLIAADFQNEPRALDRMKGLFGVLYDAINDPTHKISLSCNVATPQCEQTRNAPDDGRLQFPAAYYSIDANAVNLCNGFFGMPHLENMDCQDGLPMSYYESAASGLFHELIHAVFEPLAKINYDFLTFDIAYGFSGCANLARGTCGEAETGLRCSPLATIANVDTMVWLVNGKYPPQLHLH